MGAGARGVAGATTMPGVGSLENTVGEAEGGAFIGQEDVGGNSIEEGDDFTEEVGAPPEGGVSTEVEEGGDSTKEAEDSTEEGTPTEGEDSTDEGGLMSVLLPSQCILDIFLSLSSCFHFLSSFFFSSCFLLLFLAFLAIQKRGAPG